MSDVVNAYRNLDKEEADLQKRLLEVQQKKESRAKELRAAQVAILGEAVLKRLETGGIEKTFLETLSLSKKEQKFFENFGDKRPQGWDKIE